jgi:CBS domain containing-hemolysin-like protein
MSEDGRPRAEEGEESPLQGLRRWLKSLRRKNGESSLREAIAELIEESEADADTAPMPPGESGILRNILNLADRTARDIMVPRADIVAADKDITLHDLVAVLTKEGHSRLPIYRESLDDTVGMVHIKDVLACLAGERPYDPTALIREVLFVAPSMRAFDLLLQMRLSRVHMALVVDEFGGVDGLVTIEDVVEEIVGEIEDEHDVAERPRLVRRADGTIVVDARTTIEEFESQFGPLLTADEREQDIATLGGLVATLTGRVPSRGELVSHASGIAFEVLDADPRRAKRLRLRNLPPPPGDA